MRNLLFVPLLSKARAGALWVLRRTKHEALEPNNPKADNGAAVCLASQQLTCPDRPCNSHKEGNIKSQITFHIAILSLQSFIKPSEAHASQWDKYSLFLRRICLNGKIQLFESNDIDLGAAVKLRSLGLMKGTLVHTSLQQPDDFTVQLICYPIPPCSPPAQSLANSHIAGVMKWMLYGPLLDDDKMIEKEERRQKEEQGV